MGTPKKFRNLYSNVREIHIGTRDGKYDLVLKRFLNIPFFELKHIYKRKGGIVLHSDKDLTTIKNAISKILQKEGNISDVEIRNPSFDALFNLFIK